MRGKFQKSVFFETDSDFFKLTHLTRKLVVFPNKSKNKFKPLFQFISLFSCHCIITSLLLHSIPSLYHHDQNKEKVGRSQQNGAKWVWDCNTKPQPFNVIVIFVINIHDYSIFHLTQFRQLFLCQLNK